MKDELYEDAKDIVIKSGRVSATYLQRMLKIPYFKSRELLDELEARGIISGDNGAKPRKVLV